jgi:RNA recognition motif-containing protein
VKNLPYDCTEEALKEAFTFCGKVSGVRLAMHNHTKQLKGFGYVEFVKEAGAEIAAKKQAEIKVRCD